MFFSEGSQSVFAGKCRLIAVTTKTADESYSVRKTEGESLWCSRLLLNVVNIRYF